MLKYVTTKSHRVYKKELLNDIELRLEENDLSLSDVLTKKQRGIFDEIINILAVEGIYEIGAEELSKRLKCSEFTMDEIIKVIKTLDEVVVVKLSDEQSGKYIFIFKNHPYFDEIMNTVFKTIFKRIKSLND